MAVGPLGLSLRWHSTPWQDQNQKEKGGLGTQNLLHRYNTPTCSHYCRVMGHAHSGKLEGSPGTLLWGWGGTVRHGTAGACDRDEASGSRALGHPGVTGV